MDEDTGKRILRTIRDKGWELYCSSVPFRSHKPGTLFARGPAKALNEGFCCDILPRLKGSPNQAALDDFLRSLEDGSEGAIPTLIVPSYSHPPSFAFGVSEFSGGDKEEFPFLPGQKLLFTGFELLEDRVRLFTAHATKTFMSYDVFLQALGTLQDISALVAPAVNP